VNFQIRTSVPDDAHAISHVIRAAFGADQGQEISDLVNDLFDDQTALPMLSLVATNKGNIIGHILFTATHLKEAPIEVQSSILAPVSVHPDFQNTGIGGQLIRTGFERLQEQGVGIVFVLGYPDYYRRYGFVPAGEHGFEAPYPIAEEHADAWMVKELQPGLIKAAHGLVVCANALDHPKYWQE